MPDCIGFKKKDCPYERSEIEQCPAFLVPEKAKHFPCSHKKTCEEEIEKIHGKIADLTY